MIKKALILAVAIIFCFSETALAQIPPSILQNQNRIQQEQQRLIEMLIILLLELLSLLAIGL